MKICLIVAMEAEASYLIKKLNLEKKSDNSTFYVYQNKLSENEIILYFNKKIGKFDRIGTVNAAVLTHIAIEKESPDFIINTGTSGGIEGKSVDIFDVLVSENFVLYHDRYISEEFLNYSLGFYKCEEINKINFEFKKGFIATGNSLILSEKSWEIIDRYNVSCIDMESAAVGNICSEHNVKFLSIKVITDIVRKLKKEDTLNTISQFVQNFHYAMTVLSEKIELIFKERCI